MQSFAIFLMATDTSEQGFVDLSPDDFSKFSDAKRVTVTKFFGNRTTVRIPLCRMVLNGTYGGFGLSEELRFNLYVRTFGTPPESGKTCSYMSDFGETVYSRDFDVQMRADPILIEEILKLGLAASGTSP